MHHGTRITRSAKLAASIVLLTLAAHSARAAESVDTDEARLIAVLRESHGANKQEESLQPFGKVRAQLSDGRELEVEASWFNYLGDMHIRLVFDGERQLQSAAPEDLQRLHLSPELALEKAVSNLRRVYGAPAVQPYVGGLMQVQGRAPAFNSSYFLDREFWQSLQRQHPEGLVAAVPQRGGLVFAPASDDEALANLRFSVAALYAGGDAARVSSALYLFKDGRWSVFQPPQP